MRLLLGDLVGDGTPAETTLTQKIVTTFTEQAPGIAADLGAALRAADPAAAAYHAHRLRGSAATLGADSVAGVCSVIEKHALAGEIHPARTHHGRLGPLLVRATRDLSDAMHSLLSPVPPDSDGPAG